MLVHKRFVTAIFTKTEYLIMYGHAHTHAHTRVHAHTNHVGTRTYTRMRARARAYTHTHCFTYTLNDLLNNNQYGFTPPRKEQLM